MSEFEQLVLDYDQFEYLYDTYGYEDAVGDREYGIALVREAFVDEKFRLQTVERLQEIADEDDEYHDQALELIARIKKIGEME